MREKFYYLSPSRAAEFSLKQHTYNILSHSLLLSGDTVAIVRTRCFGKLMI